MVVMTRLQERQSTGDSTEILRDGGSNFDKRLQKFSFEGFLKALDEAKILVDFDARTGHNHGTKFRMRQDALPMLYEKQEIIL